MNQPKNKILAIVLALILCIGLLAACGTKKTIQSGDSAILGTWKMVSIETGGKKTSAEDYLKSANAKDVPVLTFDSEGIVTLDVEGDSGTGTWENTGGQYTLTYQSDGKDIVKEIILNGDQLTLEQNGFSLTYEKN